ncbi:AraC family transcriptional regulator [Sessilibacter corallicola]|uniref:AraC family transcriptional regulator n=1 Tax=Sessilibacter corallicola TaxID=2904075 RepID=UPI001E5868AD|nr:AraC family transcriptional regulator [Sessilibacter corallicola]
MIRSINDNPSISLRSYCSDVHVHSHDYHQLVLPITGKLDMCVDENEGYVCQQRAAVIAQGRDHGFSSVDHNQFLVADIPSILAPELKELPSFIKLDESLLQYNHFLHRSLMQGQTHHNSQRQMLVLLVQLLKERFCTTKPIDHRIQSAQNYIDRYFNQTITLAEIAAIAHLSTRQLSQLFKDHFNTTPLSYQIEKRMQHALHLLETSNACIESIAESVGYKNLSAFSDRFKKHFGCSPKHIRQIDK